jgi:accessory gene regulator protein AgrB
MTLEVSACRNVVAILGLVDAEKFAFITSDTFDVDRTGTVLCLMAELRTITATFWLWHRTSHNYMATLSTTFALIVVEVYRIGALITAMA